MLSSPPSMAAFSYESHQSSALDYAFSNQMGLAAASSSPLLFLGGYSSPEAFPEMVSHDVLSCSSFESGTKMSVGGGDAHSPCGAAGRNRDGEVSPRKQASMEKKRKGRLSVRRRPSCSDPVSVNPKDGVRKRRGSRAAKGAAGDKEPKPSGVVEKKRSPSLPEQPLTGYIHVRARRGQATDSHSLAERVRREKISERMRLLQGLVPGCEKVTGKALMLDEIINYVQSLQNQVEFLSMRLSSENPIPYDFGLDMEEYLNHPQPQEGMSPQMAPPPVQQAMCHIQPPAVAGATTDYTIAGNSFSAHGHTDQTPAAVLFSQGDGGFAMQMGDIRLLRHHRHQFGIPNSFH